MLQQQVCTEKKNQTSFILHDGTTDTHYVQNNDRVLKFTKMITLEQQPTEVIELQCSLTLVPTSYQYNQRTYNSSNYNGRDRQWRLRNYDIILTFQNHLHEVSDDYSYEIEAYQQVNVVAAQSCRDPRGQLRPVDLASKEFVSHTLLFSQKHSRQTRQISVKGSINESDQSRYSDNFQSVSIDTISNNRHICCSIRRSNTKTTTVDVHQQSIVNVGAMLLERGLYSDVSLVVSGQIFRVHKEILSSASDVFKTMFSHKMIEVQRGEVIIRDFEPDIVEGLLSFIYTGKTSLLSKKPIRLFQIAHKYQIDNLKAQSLESLLFIVNKNNVVNMLTVANMYELTDFETNLRKFITNHEKEMVRVTSYQQFLSSKLKIQSVVYTLKMCDKYKQFLHDVEIKTFEFVKKHNKDLLRNEEFLKLFESHPALMKRLYVCIHEDD